MSHARRIVVYQRMMEAKGIAASTASPPLWRLLWSWGVALPPPLYMRIVPLFVLCGSAFGLLFGASAFLLGNRGYREMSLDEALLVALCTGVFFGLIVAWRTRRLARRHALGDWCEVRAAASTAEALAVQARCHDPGMR